VGELTHSVTQALAGSSSHSLMWLVHILSIIPDRKASVNLYIFNSKLNWDGIYIEKILSLVWLLTLREEILAKIFFSLASKSSLGVEFRDWKSKILPKYLKDPPRGTWGIIPLSLRLTLGRIC